jgi:hypothetical protein
MKKNTFLDESYFITDLARIEINTGSSNKIYFVGFADTILEGSLNNLMTEFILNGLPTVNGENSRSYRLACWEFNADSSDLPKQASFQNPFSYILPIPVNFYAKKI